MNSFKKYIVLSFTFVFLFLTTGFSYYQSFCNDGCVTELSLFESIDSCCEDSSKNEDSCHNDQEHEDSEDDCCGVEQISVAMDIDMESNQVFAFNFECHELVIEPLYNYNSSLDEASLLIDEPLRGPPLPVKSGRVLLLEKNTFLI